MNRLKQYLTQNSIGQKEFADRCRVTQPTISRLLSGGAQPSLALAKRIEEETGGAVRFYDWPAYSLIAPDANGDGRARA